MQQLAWRLVALSMKSTVQVVAAVSSATAAAQIRNLNTKANIGFVEATKLKMRIDWIPFYPNFDKILPM